MTIYRILIERSDMETLLDLPTSIEAVLGAEIDKDGNLVLDVESLDHDLTNMRAVYGPIIEEGILNLAGFEPLEPDTGTVHATRSSESDEEE